MKHSKSPQLLGGGEEAGLKVTATQDCVTFSHYCFNCRTKTQYHSSNNGL